MGLSKLCSDPMPSENKRGVQAVRAYWIEGPWKGRLAIVPRPRGGDWLEDEIVDWGQLGINTVVSFLTPEEIAAFDLESEKALCEAHGIRFVSFPIEDRGVPASRAATANLVNDLKQSLVKGDTVALHCRQSVGRSALVAACLLVASGVQPQKAFERISAARGCAVPETLEQERWMTSLDSARAPSSGGFPLPPA
jgi:protein-tyrosine phosphatase